MNAETPQTPAPVMGLYDRPMWDSIRERKMRLQRGKVSGTWLYPPGPGTPGGEELEWTPISGNGTILSWVIFHRQYLPAYPAPYNVIAVRLDEGPTIISNLEGKTPEGNWIGRRVKLVYADMPDGAVLPRFTLAE